ncbi:hypothetical protein LTH96_12580 [Nesterenkonia sp. LB17]|uniref:hypothetical protein n=1 Tax=Nesterenkonia sp. LB17 TaxID=2901230 RepID=UPI001F4CCFE2|nr:hypothetical protein [Nesterenkonia sp. LB17]MCH8566550.1 hypothetical protein [Nesterenkonia sp. LB17]
MKPSSAGSTPESPHPRPPSAGEHRAGADFPADSDFPSDNEVRDTPAEVDAAFRAQRGVALAYFVVFLVLVAAFPVLTMTLQWWTQARVFGDLSPGFVAAAGGLYLVFAIIGIAAARLSASVESRMLGGQHGLDDDSAAGEELK